jgi:hypothetical protein
MRRRTISFSFLSAVFLVGALASTRTSRAQSIQGLPKTAVVIETAAIPQHPQRQLVLWMENPKKNPRDTSEDLYTCPEYTRGSYYSGPTRVSLYDPASKTIINTINLIVDEVDSFDVPYAIKQGYYYSVPGIRGSSREAKPTILLLKDYNGDGKALEFALFDAVACMGLQTTLIGYSNKKDRVVQYPLQLTVIEKQKRSTSSVLWIDYLLSRKPVRPGYWKYEVDYRGRGGSLDKWDVRFSTAREQFEGTLTRVLDE